MKNYLELLSDILANGETRPDRTGVGTISVFGRQIRFNLEEGFPAVTTKKLAWNAVKGELLWFLSGSGNERDLAKITHGTTEGVTTIWTPNAMAPYWKPKAQSEGDLGRVYGVQWRHWKKYRVEKDMGQAHKGGTRLAVDASEVDQIANLIEGLKTDPYSRRHILTAWNVGELDAMSLPPCHLMAMFYVSGDRKLSCHMTMRSCDLFLGNPFNISSYALLTHMIAQVCGFGVGELLITMNDAHIYLNHVDQVKEQLKREPLPLPKLWLNPEIKDIDAFTMDDIDLVGYQSHGPIKAPMAV